MSSSLIDQRPSSSPTEFESSTSLYFSVNNETLSNAIVEELTSEESEQNLDKTMIPVEEETILKKDLDEEKHFETNLKLKLVKNILKSCSTPKAVKGLEKPEVIVPKIVVTESEESPRKLGTKEMKRVTIFEKPAAEDGQKENKINVANNSKAVKSHPRRSIRPPSAVVPKVVSLPTSRKSSLRKSLIPKTNPGNDEKEKVTENKKEPRKSMRMSLAAPKSTHRYTLVGRPGARLNSPLKKKSPGTKKISNRFTNNFTAPLPPALKVQTKATEEVKTTVADVKKRMSRIPTTSEQTSLNQTKKPDLECDVCKKKFSFRTSLMTHKKIHDPTFHKLVCQYCSKEFEKEVGLKNHLERYCVKVPTAEKRKLDLSNSDYSRSRPKMEKSSIRQESSSSLNSIESSISSTSLKLKKLDKEDDPKPNSPKSAIKSIKNAHSGLRMKGIDLKRIEPYRCFGCNMTFIGYVEFNKHKDGGSCKRKN